MQMGMSQTQATGVIERNLSLQASMLGANDIFWISGVLFFVLIGFVWLTKPAKGGGGGGAAPTQRPARTEPPPAPRCPSGTAAPTIPSRRASPPALSRSPRARPAIPTAEPDCLPAHRRLAGSDRDRSRTIPPLAARRARRVRRAWRAPPATLRRPRTVCHPSRRLQRPPVHRRWRARHPLPRAMPPARHGRSGRRCRYRCRSHRRARPHEAASAPLPRSAPRSSRAPAHGRPARATRPLRCQRVGSRADEPVAQPAPLTFRQLQRGDLDTLRAGQRTWPALHPIQRMMDIPLFSPLLHTAGGRRPAVSAAHPA